LTASLKLAQNIDALSTEMRLEQELAALREARGPSQRDLAKLLGTSQPYVAKLESGRIKNLGVKTLAKCAHALGGSLTVKIEPHPRPVRRKPWGTPKTGH
jgi:transcriptional regulator with XRE-family HTH domain